MTTLVEELRDEIERLTCTVEDLRAQLTPVLIPHTWGLTDKQEQFLSILLTSRGTVTRRMMMAQLYQYSEDEPDQKVLDVMLCKIRRAIPSDMHVDTVWGRGWVVRDRIEWLDKLRNAPNYIDMKQESQP